MQVMVCESCPLYCCQDDEACGLGYRLRRLRTGQDESLTQITHHPWYTYITISTDCKLQVLQADNISHMPVQRDVLEQDLC